MGRRVGRLIDGRVAVFIASLAVLAVGVGMVVGGLLSVVVGVGAGLITASTAAGVCSFLLEDRRPR